MFCRSLSGTAEEETKIPGAAGSCKPKSDRSARRRPMKMPAFWRKAVSYTHLDVYKRQPWPAVC